VLFATFWVNKDVYIFFNAEIIATYNNNHA